MDRLPTVLFILAAALLLPFGSWAACTSWSVTNPQETHKLTTKEIVECVNQGVAPPKEWIPDPGIARRAGAKAGGSGGFASGTIAAPEMPPSKVSGAQPSIPKNVMDFFNKLKSTNNEDPVAGATPHACNTPDSGAPVPRPGAAWSCPVNDAIANYFSPIDGKPKPCEDFGSVTQFSGAQTIPLACGGVVPLTNYRLTLADTPTGFVRTDKSDTPPHYTYIYKNVGSKYALEGGAGVKLPEYLCEWYTDAFGVKKKRPSSTPPFSLAPRSQMIMINASTKAVALRVIPEYPDDLGNPFTLLDPDEHYLLLPIIAGNVYVPSDDPTDEYKNCDIQDDFFKPFRVLSTPDYAGDIIIESSQVPGCEADADTCKAMKQSTEATSSLSCETANYYTSGTTCDRKIQYMVLNRPNLYFPPGSNAKLLPIEKLTSFMLSTNSFGSYPTRMLDNSDKVVHVNRASGVFTFLDGAVIDGRVATGSSSRQRIWINGPVVFDMNALTITMQHGGELRAASGTPLTVYPDNTVLPIPPATLPLSVLVGQNILMPPNYAIPTQPAIYPDPKDKTKAIMPYVREPLALP